jgi:predicted DNA-binding transcriptional regulator AlpA
MPILSTRRPPPRRKGQPAYSPGPAERSVSAATAALVSAAASTAAADPDAYMSQPQVKALLGGVTDTTIERWRKDPRLGFPAPTKFGGHRNFYRRADIIDWAAQRAKSQLPERLQ